MKRFSPRDVAAGLSLAGLMLPEAVAYAAIAGLPPGRALTAAICGGIAYFLIGKSRFAVVSPTSSSAAILAAALASLALPAEQREVMAAALTLMVGVLFLGFAVFRLGSFAAFISRPVLRGFAFGLAATIVVRQLPKLAGIAVAPGPIWDQLGELLARASTWHWFSIVIGVGSLCVLLGMRRIPRMPATLIVIVGGIALGSVFDLPAHGVALVGLIDFSFALARLPTDFSVWAHLAQLAAPIALILFAESWGTIRTLALQEGDGGLSPNRELAAIGIANCLSGGAQGMPVGAGFSAGSASAAAGSASRFAVAIASLALLALAVAGRPFIARIPEPVLAAVVVAALTHALSPGPILRLFRIGRDQWVAVAAALGVLALGVLNGMLVAIALSIAELLYRLSHPSISELGRVGDGHDFIDIARHADARRIGGVMIVRPNAPLFFANAESVLRAIAAKLGGHAISTIVFSLEESSDLDSTAVEALCEFAAAQRRAGRRVILARAHDRVRDVLAATGAVDLADNSTYSVADAIASASMGPDHGDEQLDTAGSPPRQA